MSHSLDLGPESGINSTFAALKLLERPEAPLTGAEPLVPGVFLNFDPEAGVEALVESRPDHLLSARFTVAQPARWLALHVELGRFDLAGKMMVGLACRSRAPVSTTFRPCLRSGAAEGFTDLFFRKTVIAYDEPSLHLDALAIEDHPDLGRAAPWRELILFFQPEGGTVDLQDLRLFVI